MSSSFKKNTFILSNEEKLLQIHNIPLRLLFISLLVFSSCKTYYNFPNSYVIRGDENFVNVDKRLTIYLGPDFLADEFWQLGNSPVNSLKLTAYHQKLLNKLGYDKNVYASLFQSTDKMPFELLALVNKEPLSRSKNGLLRSGKLKRKVTDNGEWFYEILKWNNEQVYHAVIPISEKPFSEKYLSFIYIADKAETNFDVIENIVERNATKYKGSYLFVPSKTVIDCQNEKDQRYYDYTIPDNYLNEKDYMLLKVFTGNRERKLIFYTLLEPGQRMGAFKICKGRYSLQYTTLENTIHWHQELIIE